MKEMREALCGHFENDWTESVARPIELLNQQMERLQLKEMPFSCFPPSDEDAIEKMWRLCFDIDANIEVILTLTIHVSCFE